MKIICSKANLLYAVNTVSKAVPTRTTMAILECILIDASTDVIKLTANDMELGIETIVEGTVGERGVIALDARTFTDIVRKLPDNEVTIETVEAFKTEITCEKARFEIVGKSGEDFSPLPVIDKKDEIVISQLSFKDVIRQTIFSVSDDESSKIMTGECFEIKGDRLRVISLDGHRISVRNIILNQSYPDKKIIIPGKTLQEISKILAGESEDSIEIYVGKNHCMFRYNNTTVVSRLIEGEFFKVDQMLVAEYDTLIRINKRELLDCIDRVTPLVKEGDKKPIIMNITDDKMELRIQSFIGSFNEDLDIQKEGKDIQIAFNPKFCLDALRVIDDEEISIYMRNAKSPCFIKDQEENYIYLILPVNFNSGI